MSAIVRRHWHSLSPALRRYYRASVLPSIVFVALAALHEVVSRQPDVAQPLRVAAALAPLAAMTWAFSTYLRFLRECDELERRIELGALAWAAGIALHGLFACLMLLDAHVVDWRGEHVAASGGLLLIASYALIRYWLHRRYA